MIILIITLFTALWSGDHSAVVNWYQTERTCLYYQSSQQPRTALQCYDQVDSTVTVSIGAVGPLDGAYRPMPGGIYTLETADEIYTTRLVAQKQYLPVIH